MISSSKRGRAKPKPKKTDPVIVVDYGSSVPTLEAPDHDAPQVGIIDPGVVLTKYKQKDAGTDRWIECDQGWIYVGKTGSGVIKDPAVMTAGPRPQLDRILARLPSLRGYRYGRGVDFPKSANGPAKHTNTNTKQIDCSSFTWACLAWAYNVAGVASYKRHQLIDTPDPWSPIANCQLMGVASDIGEGHPHKDGIYLCQTWIKPDQFRGGHQFILIINGPESFNRLEASSRPDCIHNAPVWTDGSPAWDPYVSGEATEKYHAHYLRGARLKDCDIHGSG